MDYIPFIPQYFKSDLLLCHNETGFFVHSNIIDAHTTKDGKSLNKVFIIFREWQAIEFVDQLE